MIGDALARQNTSGGAAYSQQKNGADEIASAAYNQLVDAFGQAGSGPAYPGVLLAAGLGYTGGIPDKSAPSIDDVQALKNIEDMAAAYKASGMTGATGDATEFLPTQQWLIPGTGDFADSGSALTKYGYSVSHDVLDSGYSKVSVYKEDGSSSSLFVNDGIRGAQADRSFLSIMLDPAIGILSPAVATVNNALTYLGAKLNGNQELAGLAGDSLASKTTAETGLLVLGGVAGARAAGGRGGGTVGSLEGRLAAEELTLKPYSGNPLSPDFVGPPILAAAERLPTLTADGLPIRYDIPKLYHYTNEAGMEGIVKSGELNPSLWREGTKDVRYGEGQYLTDIQPGTLPPANIARELIGVPNKYKFTNYVEINTMGLPVVVGRPGAFVIRGTTPLDLTGRILGNGKTQ